MSCELWLSKFIKQLWGSFAVKMEVFCSSSYKQTWINVLNIFFELEKHGGSYRDWINLNFKYLIIYSKLARLYRRMNRQDSSKNSSLVMKQTKKILSENPHKVQKFWWNFLIFGKKQFRRYCPGFSTINSSGNSRFVRTIAWIYSHTYFCVWTKFRSLKTALSTVQLILILTPLFLFFHFFSYWMIQVSVFYYFEMFYDCFSFSLKFNIFIK